MAKISAEETEGLQKQLNEMLFTALFNGEPFEVLLTYCQATEQPFGYFGRTLPQEEMVGLFDIEGLEAKDVKMLRELGLLKIAQVIEDDLASLSAAPADGPKEPSKRRAEANVVNITIELK